MGVDSQLTPKLWLLEMKEKTKEMLSMTAVMSRYVMRYM